MSAALTKELHKVGGKKPRTIVIWISIIITLMAFGYFAYVDMEHLSVPLWDKVAMSYGGVFCVFLFFDEIGRQAARNRKDRDSGKDRPRPQGSAIPGRQVPAVQTQITTGQLRLERVRPTQVDIFQTMVDEAMTEVLALQEVRPQLDEQGHVAGVDVDGWLRDTHYYPFFMMYHDFCIGCCVLHVVHPANEIKLFYIQSSMRRRRGGSAALEKLIEFAQLVGTHTTMTCEMAADNMRGQRFFQANGFRPVRRNEVPLGRVELARDVHLA